MATSTNNAHMTACEVGASFGQGGLPQRDDTPTREHHKVGMSLTTPAGASMAGASSRGAGCGAGAGAHHMHTSAEPNSPLPADSVGMPGRAPGSTRSLANVIPLSVIRIVQSYLGDWHDMLNASSVCKAWTYAYATVPCAIKITSRLVEWYVSWGFYARRLPVCARLTPFTMVGFVARGTLKRVIYTRFAAARSVEFVNNNVRDVFLQRLASHPQNVGEQQPDDATQTAADGETAGSELCLHEPAPLKDSLAHLTVWRCFNISGAFVR